MVTALVRDAESPRTQNEPATCTDNLIVIGRIYRLTPAIHPPLVQ